MKSIIYIGMDAHKNTYSLCGVYSSTGEIAVQTKCDADVKNILKFIESAKERAGEDNEIEVIAGYEAGCLGFSLYHELAYHDVQCVILAPSTMHGSYKAVHVPTEHDSEIKEYIGLREDVIISRKRIKQQMSALVLRHGFRYEGKSNWTTAHVKWLERIDLPVIVRETLNEYLKVYDHLNERIEKYNERIEEYEEPVSKISCFKGIDTLSAMKIHVTVSDFQRFPTAKAFMANLGMLPGENSSAEKYSNTPITKMGNAMVRKTLVEYTQALVKGTGKKSKALKKRQKGQDDAVIAYADRAVERLQKRYKRMVLRGKPYNVAIMAAAREPARFI